MRTGVASAVVMFAVVAAVALAMRDHLAAPHTASAAPAGAPVTSPTPAPAIYAGGHTAQLRKEADGHYWTTAYVNGMPTRFMVDTGASVIALTTRDAQRIGLDVETLPKNADISTANGHVQAASAMLDLVKIGGVEVEHVRAVVIDKGLDTSLLGMSFLGAMHDMSVTPEAIVIRQ